jgi:PXA domain
VGEPVFRRFAMAARRTSRFSTSYRSADARSAASTPTSKVPVSLAKRLLFPNLSHGADLPSLLAADDRELNAELYDFIALALRGFVTPWWTKITKHDKEFLPEITRVIAVFLRSVETRLASADLPTFVFRDVPAIVSQHYADYRNACAKVGTSYATGGSSTLPQIFHQLQPHMAVSPDGHWNETYIRQAVEHVMRSCLPPADWEAETERTIVREILAKVILGSVFSRLTQPWYLQKLILDLLGPPPDDQLKVKLCISMFQHHLNFIKPPDLTSRPTSRRRLSFQSIVVFFLSAVQIVSGLCLTAIALSQKALYTIRAINSSSISPITVLHHENLARLSIVMMAEILTMRSRASSAAILSLVELSAGFCRPFTDR